MKSNNRIMPIVFTLMTVSLLTMAEIDADNSKVNRAKGITADQQKSNNSDTQITAQIRKDIMKERNFSTYAQNIKIITINGKVTLKGPVRTTNEANTILKYARSVAGVTNVVNEIAITPEN